MLTVNCYYCGAPVLSAEVTESPVEVPEGSEVATLEPCALCADSMAEGIVLIGILDGETGKVNPIRTGLIATVKDGWVNEYVDDIETATALLSHRFGFVEAGVWERCGLGGQEAH